MTVTSGTKKPDSDAGGARQRQPSAAEQIAQTIRDWLPNHCRRLPGVTRAIALAANAGTHGYRLLAGFPTGFQGTPEMIALADPALNGRSEAKLVKKDSEIVDLLSMPITHQGDFLGALVVEARGLDDAKRRALYALAKGKAPEKTTPPEEAEKHRLAIALDLISCCLDNSKAQSAAMTFVSELAVRTGCDRVSYGRLNRRGQARLTAISGTAKIAGRSTLVRAIEAAMEEAIDQGRTITFPRSCDAVMADRENAALSRLQGQSHILTIPLVHDGNLVGALTLERHGATPLGPDVIRLCETLAAVAGPVLELRHRDDQPLLGKIADATRRMLHALTGPRYVAAKLAAVIALLLLGWFSFAQGTYNITAPARLEGTVHRAVVAPIDGFVASADARAGDEVAAGDLLSRLDDSELQLEIAKWQSETAQLRKQYRGALAAHDRAETAILRARIDRAEAQLALLQAQLSRTELRAPFAGIVVAGDMSQLLGSPVERGDVMFEVAPLDDYRVVLEVDDRDLTSVRTGQTGRLALAGLPSEQLLFTIEKITPVATARDGRNFFRVEAQLDAGTPALRPGMAGVAKIEAGERRLLWIWTHRITDWLRLSLWRWLP